MAVRRSSDDTSRIAAVWQRVRGMRCICRPHCTDARWGNGPVECDPACQPCRVNAGERYDPPL